MKKIKFKCFDKESKKWSKTPLDYQIKDINFYTDYEWLQYLGFNDANDQELYEGDVVELEITKELMTTSFNNSNLGLYCREHPEVTHILLEFRIRDVLTMDYHVYQKINGELDYRKNGNAVCISSGEDTMFPRYITKKGATYIGNTVESPMLLKKEYIPSVKDIINLYYQERDKDYIGNYVVLKQTSTSFRLQSLNDGKELWMNKDKAIELNHEGCLIYNGTMTLENYIKDLVLYSDYYSSDKEAVDRYLNYFKLTDKDKEYLATLELDIPDEYDDR